MAAVGVFATLVRVVAHDPGSRAARTGHTVQPLDDIIIYSGTELLQQYLLRPPNYLPAHAVNECRANWAHSFPIDAVGVGVGKLACCSNCDTGVVNTRLNDTQQLALHVKKSPRVVNM